VLAVPDHVEQAMNHFLTTEARVFDHFTFETVASIRFAILEAAQSTSNFQCDVDVDAFEIDGCGCGSDLPGEADGTPGAGAEAAQATVKAVSISSCCARADW
jgi:hypothetical protein